MSRAADQVVNLIFGRWRSQILYAGAALGLFDHLSESDGTSATTLAPQIQVNPDLLYRLMRALASLGLLAEDDSRSFRLTDAGALLREEDAHSMKAMALLEEGPEHYAAWKHLLTILRAGGQNGFIRELGAPVFQYARENPSYGSLFNRAMSSYSAIDAQGALAALADEDFSSIGILCDVAGGHGRLACDLLNTYPHLSAVVFDLPEVVSETDRLWAPKLRLSERCRYLGGDMFHEVPAAEAYTLKAVLHDWSDEECIRILRNIRQAGGKGARIFVIEFVVPGPEEPHFAKLFDIHMMCVLTGRERTAGEYAELLAASGWRYAGVRSAPGALKSVIVASAA